MQKNGFYERLFKSTLGQYEAELSEEARHRLARKYIRTGIYFFWILLAGMLLEGGVLLAGKIIGEPLRLSVPTFIWFLIFSGLSGYFHRR